MFELTLIRYCFIEWNNMIRVEIYFGSFNCVFQKISIPPLSLTEDHSKFQGGEEFKGSYFRGVGGIHGKLLFHRVTNHKQNIKSNVQSIISTKTYICCFETKISTPGH